MGKQVVGVGGECPLHMEMEGDSMALPPLVVGCRIDRVGMARPTQPNKQPYFTNH